MDDSKRGLYAKYTVTKIEDGTPVNGCFVLRPARDAYSRAALAAYADACKADYPQLAADLELWLACLANPEKCIRGNSKEAPATPERAVSEDGRLFTMRFLDERAAREREEGEWDHPELHRILQADEAVQSRQRPAPLNPSKERKHGPSSRFDPRPP